MSIAADARNDFAPIETARLVLSAGTADDAAVLFPHVHGEAGRAVTDMLRWDGPDTVEEMANFFALVESGTFAEGGFHWLLRDRTGKCTGTPGQPVGAIGLEGGSREDACEIGYWLAAPYWGRGLMAEAIVAISQFAFAAGYRMIEADVYVDNVRSCALVEKLGFQKGELISGYVIKRGVPKDAYRYVLTEPG